MSLIQAINGNLHNSLISRNSVFLTERSVKRVSKSSNRYYGVRLVQAKDGHYVQYHHRIPADLAQRVPPEEIKKAWVNKQGQLLEWARFRVKGLLNSVTAEDYPEYAAELLHSVKLNLQNGYDPFKDLMRAIKEEVQQLSPVVDIVREVTPKITVRKAIDEFLKQYPVKKVKNSYRVVTDMLEKFLGDRVQGSIKAVAKEDLREMLRDLREAKEWTGTTYNDKVKKLRTFFNFCVDEKEWFKESPANKVKLLEKVDKAMNTALTDDDAVLVKQKMLAHEMQPYGLLMHRFCMTVYYTLSRPVEETRQMKRKDINFERKLITFASLRAKGGQGGSIPMAPELESMFREMGVDKLPGEYYIFGEEFTPGPIAIPEQRFQWFWREKIRRPNNLNEDYTIYSFKHMRVIHLYESGVKPADIQRMCRHKSATEFETYLRDLGLDLSEDINLNAKKF